jgi:hypothetical protein
MENQTYFYACSITLRIKEILMTNEPKSGWYNEHIKECWNMWLKNTTKLKLVLSPRTHVVRVK